MVTKLLNSHLISLSTLFLENIKTSTKKKYNFYLSAKLKKCENENHTSMYIYKKNRNIYILWAVLQHSHGRL